MEITANALQTVSVNGNVLFTDTAVKGNCAIVHREGSGLTTLRGLTNQNRARFKVSFGANVALPANATLEPIEVAIAISGEPILSTRMVSTPTAVEEFNNIFSAIFIDVPACCCYQITVQNIGETDIDVENANLIVERVA